MGYRKDPEVGPAWGLPRRDVGGDRIVLATVLAYAALVLVGIYRAARFRPSGHRR
jgi:hypothetical protein